MLLSRRTPPRREVVFGIASLVALAAFAALPAQTPPALIGAVAQGPNTTLWQQTLPCGLPGPACTPTLPLPTQVWAGGTAYDPGEQTVWMTDGLQLVGFHPVTCAVTCAPSAIPGLPLGNRATGLAFNEIPRRLWVLTDVPSLLQLNVPAGGGCPSFASTCALTIPGGRMTGGLAISESLQTVFYAASFFSGLPANLILAAPLANPCTPTCQFTLGCAPVSLRAITGLAFDDCTGSIYATDGLAVADGVFQTGNCTVVNAQCCLTPVVPMYVGLEIEASHPTPWGTSCTSAPCQACSGVTLTTIGDSSIGNLLFAFRVTNAPTNSVFGAIYFNLGPCTAGASLGCGLYYPSGFSILCPGFVPTGAACAGTATCQVPLPVLPFLCGFRFCAQMFLYCSPGGSTLSNGVNFLISDT